jgi:hemerythrin superfamily protein
MLRDKNLIPLSHQHRRALILCVGINRSQPIAEKQLTEWQGEIDRQFQREISNHFLAEEDIVYPAAARFPELAGLVKELRAEHQSLRVGFAEAGLRKMSAEHLVDFGRSLSAHIRREERELFQGLQRLLSPDELADLGSKLDVALRDAGQTCAVPVEVEHLR